MRNSLLCFIFILLANQNIASDDNVKKYVFDYSSSLSTTDLTKLESIVANTNQKLNCELAVYISSENSDAPHDYATKQFNTLRLGDRRYNNGLLIYVFTTLRRVELVTGYGYEWILTDSMCMIIVDSIITGFKMKDFMTGLSTGVRMIEQHSKSFNWKSCQQGQTKSPCIQEFRILKITTIGDGKLTCVSKNNEALIFVYKINQLDLIYQFKYKENFIIYSISESKDGKNEMQKFIGALNE